MGPKYTDPWIRDFETVQETQWKRFRHGLVTEPSSVVDDKEGEEATGEVRPEEAVVAKDPIIVDLTGDEIVVHNKYSIKAGVRVPAVPDVSSGDSQVGEGEKGKVQSAGVA